MSSNRLMAALQQMDGQVLGHIEDTNRKGEAISLEQRDAPLDVLNLVAHGWYLKSQINDLETELKAITKQLLAGIGVGHAVVVEGVTRATLVERNTINIEMPAHLRAALGDRFDDLVKVEITYKPEPRLIELACGADNALSADIRDCLSVKTTQSVTWRPSK